MKCAICGDEIEGKGKKLADGNTVCEDCYESSPMIVACDECGGEVLAVNAAKDEGTLYCMSCFRQIVRESDFIGEDWENWQDENDEKGSIEDWAKYLNDYLEDAQKEYSVSRMWMKMARDEVARMVEAAKNAAA